MWLTKMALTFERQDGTIAEQTVVLRSNVKLRGKALDAAVELYEAKHGNIGKVTRSAIISESEV